MVRSNIWPGLVASILLGAVGHGTHASDAPDIESADVLVAVERLENDVEVVRRYLGKQKSELGAFAVDFAAPRHDFSQAQTLFRRINVLGQETAGRSPQSPPVAPDREIVPEDVLNVVRRAHDQLDIVKQTFGLASPPAKPTRVSRTRPEDVLVAMVRVQRQVNLMLVRRYLPPDVYEPLDLATIYVAGVLAHRNKELFPKIEFVPNKQPIDVFRKLLDCMALSAAIGEHLNLDVLKINVRRMRSSQTRLSNNFDVATMLLTDIAYWSESLEGADDIYSESGVMPHIVPSHVFQKASQLEAQLKVVLDDLEG